MSESSPDILALQEAEIKDFEEGCSFNIQGYVVVGPLLKKVARVLLLVKDSLNFSKRPDLMSESFPSIWIDVLTSNNNNKITVGAFYREWAPDGDRSLEGQQKGLQIFLDQLSRARKNNSANVLTIGDMNLDKNKYCDSNYGLLPLVQRVQTALAAAGMTDLDLGNTYCATRLTNDGKLIQSALDHVYTSRPDQVLQLDTKMSAMSDHSLIEVQVGFGKVKVGNRSMVVRDFRRFDQNNFNIDLALEEWEVFFGIEDPDAAASLLSTIVNRTLDKHAPMTNRKFQETRSIKVPLPEDIKQEMKLRDNLKRNLKSATKEYDRKIFLKKYSTARNRVTRMLRKNKRTRIAYKIDKDPSIKNIWKIANDIMKPSGQKMISLKENHQVVSDSKKVAEILNDFFIKKISSLREKIHIAGNNDPLEKVKRKVNGKNLFFRLKPVPEKHVANVIRKMNKKKSHGIDSISSEVLKASVSILAAPLTRIINLSLTSGKFPEIWKTAIVRPILKKGDPQDKTNYRPVSLLCVPSMILEKIVSAQIQDFFEKNELLGKNQMGFRRNRSTTSAILALMTRWIMAADKGEASGCVLFDLSAAFDCLDKDILCKKLYFYGFDKKSVDWVYSYLTNRQQCVQIGDQTSETKHLPFGSPQGSCLSPLLFLILVADIDEWTDLAELFGFADDTTGFFTANSVEELEKKINAGVKDILKFMSANLLVVNPSKTGYLANFKGKGVESAIQVGVDKVKSAAVHDLLGLKLSSDLSWSHQFNSLKSALNQRLFILRRLRESIPKKQLTTVADAIFNSQIRYGLAAYAKIRLNEDDPLNNQMAAIQRIQNEMLRTIQGKKKSDQISIKQLLTNANFKSVNQMAVNSVLQETFKIIKYNTEPFIRATLMDKKGASYNTRNQNKKSLNVIMVNKTSSRSFIQNAALAWNHFKIFDCDNLSKKYFKAVTDSILH